jgi:hypothetical protein
MHYVDHLGEHGTALFRLACQHDLAEMAKRMDSSYAMEGRKSTLAQDQNSLLQREGEANGLRRRRSG